MHDLITMPEIHKNWGKIATTINIAIENDQAEVVGKLFINLHLGDQVEVFNLLGETEKAYLLNHIGISETAHLFSHQEDDETLEASEALSLERLADVLEEMEPDEAADLLGDLPSEQAKLALEEMEDAEDIRKLLTYADETAGGRMTTEYIATEFNTTSREAIDLLRTASPNHEVPYYIFITNKNGKLVGVTGLRELVIASPSMTMEEIMDTDVKYVHAETDQELVAQEMLRYDLTALPVVNELQQIIGVITHDDILDVVTEEATEDIYLLANVGDSDLEPESSVIDHLKGRLPWLLLNTFTALFAAWVISNFESLIAQIAVLAVFQSVVAGQGGNAGSQSVAMMVRALALGKISSNKIGRILRKATLVGLLQGASIGLVVGMGVYLWRGEAILGLVIGLALLGNMIIAAVAGTIIPLVLDSYGQDPALASSVLVTAITDSLGFFIFLSLATIFADKLL